MAIILVRRSDRLRIKAIQSSRLRQTELEEAAKATSSIRCKSKSKSKRCKRGMSSSGSLPDDAVVEILSRLPLKPFLRSKIVSKSWLSLSSHASRLKNSRSPLYGLFYMTTRKPTRGVAFANTSGNGNEVEVDVTLSALPGYDLLVVLDCCNGFLLVEGRKWESLFIGDVCVYNPVTRKLLALWSYAYPNREDEDFYQVFSLAFDAQVNSEFHVMCFSCWSKGGVKFNRLDTFSSKNGQWNQEKELGSYLTIVNHSRGTFLDGRVHRLTIHHEILSVDPNNDFYRVIQLPYLEHRTFSEIGQSQGLLCCISADEENTLFIWVLKNYDRQEWILKYQLNLHEIYSAPDALQPDHHLHLVHSRLYLHRHFAFHPGKDVLFMPMGYEDLISFDLKTGKIEFYSLPDSYSLFWPYVPCYC